MTEQGGTQTQTQEAPVEVTRPARAEQPVQDEARRNAPKSPQQRRADGRFEKERESYQASMREMHEAIRVGAQEMVRAGVGKKEAEGTKLPKETDKEALDSVKPKAQVESAKTDPASPKASTTAEAKPGRSSTENTGDAKKAAVNPKHLDAARKTLVSEGLSEEDLDLLPVERVLELGKQFRDRQKDLGAKLRDKGTAADPAPKSASTTATDSEDAEADEFEALAAETFKGFEAADGSDPKAFQKAQAQYGRLVAERTVTSLKTELQSALKNLESGFRGQMHLERTLDRAARDIPQVDDMDVRQKLTNRIAALAADPETKAEMKSDLLSVVRREALALGLKDEAAERKKKADEDLRAAKDGGQPITTQRAASPRELTDLEITRQAVRENLLKPR